MIQVFKPSITQAEIDAVADVMRSGWLGLGPKTAEFERAFAEYIGGGVHAVATNSATAALHLALIVAGVGPGDEVLVPAITFVSTAHAVRYTGAEPVFVDVDPVTLCIDVEDMRRKITARTAAIIPVHYGGHACDMDAVWREDENSTTLPDYIPVIEDAAHACGARYMGYPVGRLGSLATCFSFHAVKNLTCGEGGMITVHDAQTAERLRRLRWCGIDKSTIERSADKQYSWYYEVGELGYKYHGNDIASAIGLVQLARLPETNARRREIAERYTQALGGLAWLETPVEREYTTSSWHNYVVKTPHRDRLNEHLKAQGVATGVHYMPLHLHPYYRARSRAYLPVAERVWPTLLTLPLYPDLTDAEVEHVVGAVLRFETGGHV